MKSFLKEALTADEAALVSTGDEAEEEAAVAWEPPGPPTVDKIAEMIWQQGEIKFSSDDKGVLLVKCLDWNKKHKVNVVDRTCDCR